MREEGGEEGEGRRSGRVEVGILSLSLSQTLTLVPSGQEPPQLLSFFQGHLVIHRSPHSSPHPSPLLPRLPPSPHHKATRLYEVSGNSLEHIKAIEVCCCYFSRCYFFSTATYIISSDRRMQNAIPYH